ncbi:hypothetical protein AB4Y88_18980, partial [Paenarthrobacter sp. RAF9]
SETYLNEESDAAVLSTAGAAPGGLAKVTVRSGSDSAQINIPVVNGTLPEYKKYLPSSSATPSPSGSATPSTTATSTESAAAGH